MDLLIKWIVVTTSQRIHRYQHVWCILSVDICYWSSIVKKAKLCLDNEENDTKEIGFISGFKMWNGAVRVMPGDQ